MSDDHGEGIWVEDSLRKNLRQILDNYTSREVLSWLCAYGQHINFQFKYKEIIIYLLYMYVTIQFLLK